MPETSAGSRRCGTEKQLAAAQRLEAVGTLAGGVAHDSTNLLTGIVGFTQILRDRLAGDPEAVSDLDEVLVSAERGAALTRQLLTFARRQVIEPVLVDLNGLVSGLMKLLRRVVGEHIELKVDLAPGLPPTLADPGQLEQVLLSGYAEESVHEPLFALGGARFLAKPFGPASLARKVREALDGPPPSAGWEALDELLWLANSRSVRCGPACSRTARALASPHPAAVAR